jgi:UDP-N-acetyl-D-glucosamine dehydrogenase
MKVGIIGLGYVGLPLAVAFADAGHEVVGVDVDSRRVERLRRGESDVEDIPSERLRELAPREPDRPTAVFSEIRALR